MEILLVNFRGEVLRCMRKILIYYVTTTTYAMWMILAHSLNNSVAPVVIHLFRKQEISTAMLKSVKIEYSMFTQSLGISCANCMINLADMEFFTTMIKNCSKFWLFLILNRYVYPPSN